MVELKDEWIRIAKELVADPDASMQDIADRTGIPRSTVWYSKKRMEEENLLQLMAFLQLHQIDRVKLGLVGGAINGDKDEVLEKVANHENVWFLVDTIGPHAFTAGIAGNGEAEFQAVIDELRRLGAEGDHYGEVIEICEFGLDREFLDSFLSDAD